MGPETVWAYCERTGPGLLSEPLNTLSNVGFFLAAWSAWTRLRGLQRTQVAAHLFVLVALLVLIGVGSTLWHATAQPWAEWADVIPILAFVTVYLPSFLARALRLRPVFVVLVSVTFHVANVATTVSIPAGALNGSVGYLPMWLTLSALVATLRARRSPVTRRTTLAWALFSTSLVLRTLDRRACAVLSTGTHFLWHLCNAAMFALLLAVVIEPGSAEHEVQSGAAQGRVSARRKPLRRSSSP